MNQFNSFVIKETKHIMRDRRTMLILFGMPVVMMLVFGFAITTDIKDVKVAIVTSSMDSRTQQVVNSLDASGNFIVTHTVGTTKEAKQLLSDNKVNMAIAFSPDFGVYTRWIEEEFLPSVDVRTLADGKPGRRAAAPEPVESWVEVDGKRVRLGLPASLASVAALGAGLAGLAGAGATGDPALTSDSGESVIQALLNAYQKSVPAGSGTQTAANSDIASTQDTPIESTITGTVVRWLADDGAHVEENEPIVVLEAMKMETEITAPVAGILHRSAQVGDTAQYGDPLGAIS